MKKGIILAVLGINETVARLTTGELVYGTKEQKLKAGQIVSFYEEPKTGRYATQADVDAGTVPALTDATTGKPTVIKLAKEDCVMQNRVGQVFNTNEEYAKAFAQVALLDVHVEKEVAKQKATLEEQYA